MHRKLHRFFKNDNGFTLLEVLVSMVVLSLFAGVVYGAANSGFSSNSKVQSHIKIQQETELILAEVRRQYEDESLDKLCFNNNMLYKDESFTEKITDGNFSFTDVKVDGNPIENNSCQKVRNADFLIAFRIKDEMNNNISISTAMSKLTAFNTTEKTSIEKSTVENPGNEPSPDPENPIITKPERVFNGCLVDQNKNMYMVKGDNGKDGNKKVCEQIGASKLVFNKELHIGGNRKLIIYGDVEFNGPVFINSDSKLCVRGKITGVNRLSSYFKNGPDNDSLTCYSVK